jgi:hypothetical protein
MAEDKYTVQDFDSLSLAAPTAPPGMPIVETLSPSSVDYKAVGIFISEDPTRVCGAAIGTSGTKFCTCWTDNCTKSSHKVGQKLLIMADSIYIIGKKNVASNAVHLKLSKL